MRPTPEQAMVRVKDYIALLEAKGVPTALFRERVRDIQEWGRSVQIRKPNPRAPKSEAMKKVQHTLDGAVASEKSVREQRRNHPFYPYESEEQRRLAQTLSGIDMSQEAKESIFKALHGGDGKQSLLRADLQGSKLLSVKDIDRCAAKLPRYVPSLAARPKRSRAVCCVPAAMLRACSVDWKTETLELASADGSTQTVDIMWRDALEAVQLYFLTAEYNADELKFEPEIADRLEDQVFDDYCNSLLYYLEWSYLPDGQYPLLYELSSDGSQFGLSRQQFWSVYVTPCLPCKSRRQMMDCKILVAQLPHVAGPDEKAEMYQHAIKKIFSSMNAAGTHGVLMSFRGTERATDVLPTRVRQRACECRGR